MWTLFADRSRRVSRGVQASIFLRDWTSCIDVAIVLTIDIILRMYMYIKLCIFVYIYIYVCNCAYCRDAVFDLSRANKFIINHHQTSINMLHTRYIASFTTG